MKERGILFSAPMVRALLAGTKMQTRRVLRPSEIPMLGKPDGLCPYGEPGDRLWIRETWGFRGAMWTMGESIKTVTIEYRADGGRKQLVRGADDWHGIPRQVCRCVATGDADADYEAHNVELSRYWRSWRPSLFMPRWASRITLEVISVRVERLQDITEEDARAEGVDTGNGAVASGWARANFSELWDSLNAERAPWSSNPCVWVLTFRRLVP